MPPSQPASHAQRPPAGQMASSLARRRHSKSLKLFDNGPDSVAVAVAVVSAYLCSTKSVPQSICRLPQIPPPYLHLARRKTSTKSISMALPLQRLIPPASSRTLTIDRQNDEHDEEDAQSYDDDADHNDVCRWRWRCCQRPVERLHSPNWSSATRKYINFSQLQIVCEMNLLFSSAENSENWYEHWNWGRLTE